MTENFSPLSKAFQLGALPDHHLNTGDRDRLSVVLENEKGILLLKHVVFATTAYKPDKRNGESVPLIHSRRDYFELPYVNVDDRMMSDMSNEIAKELNNKYGIEISGEVTLYRNQTGHKFAYFDTQDFQLDIAEMIGSNGVIGADFYDEKQLEALFSRENAISAVPSPSV